MFEWFIELSYSVTWLWTALFFFWNRTTRYYQGWNRSPAQVGCMRQVLGAGALGRPRGMGWGESWEGESGWGIHVNPCLIHVSVWQKPLQYCKVISLQLIKINGKKKEKNKGFHLSVEHFSFFWAYLQVLRRLFVKSGEMQESGSEVKNNFQNMQLVILRPRKQKEGSSSLLQMVSETLLWFKFCDSRIYTSNSSDQHKLLPPSFDSFPWSY